MELTAEQLSKSTRVPLKSIYFYIERGLLKPVRINPAINESYYDLDSVCMLRKIKILRDVDLNFDQIHEILYGKGDDAILNEKMIMLQDRVSATEVLIKELDNIYDCKRFMNKYKPELKSIPDLCVCHSQGIVRDRSALPEYVASVVNEVEAANPNLKYLDPKYEFLSYDDDAHVQRELRVNCVRGVESAGRPTKNVKFSTLKGCDIVSVKHTGSYYLLSDATIAALEWMDENDYSQAGTIRFMGISEPWASSGEVNYVTEVHIPVVQNGRK